MKKLFICFLALGLPAMLAAQTLSDAQVDALIDAHRPMRGGTIPKDIKDRLGVTTAGGKYYLTDKPFVIETSEKIRDLGYTTTMYFIGNPDKQGQIKSLGWNSDWKLPRNCPMVDVVSHPYFVKALDCGQTRVVFNAGIPSGKLDEKNHDWSADGKELYDLAVYLLKTYKDRDITFILKNWEGDWVLRGGAGVQRDAWMAKTDEYRMRRINNFIEWARVRQEAVTRARNDVKNTKAKIYYAVEVNQVMDAMTRDIPALPNMLLPKVELDMVSWSSYDGMGEPRRFFRCIEYLRQQHRPTPYMKGQKYVFIGEAGIGERTVKFDVTDRWDGLFGVLFALDVPLIINWEIYCNEPVKKETKNDFSRPMTEDELRGLWIIKPDGTLGITGTYWEKILNNPGGKFPK